MGARFVYVIGVTACPVKIGVASDVPRRLATLQTGCPDLLLVHHTIKVPEFLACEIEAEAHRAFKSRHRHGEWFGVDANEARDEVLRISEKQRTQAQGQVARTGDILDELEVEFEIARNARMAMQWYRGLAANQKGNALTRQTNAAILAEVGMAAYTVFQMVLVSRSQLPPTVRLDPVAYRNAHLALSKAVNALTVIFDQRRDAELRAA